MAEIDRSPIQRTDGQGMSNSMLYRRQSDNDVNGAKGNDLSNIL